MFVNPKFDENPKVRSKVCFTVHLFSGSFKNQMFVIHCLRRKIQKSVNPKKMSDKISRSSFFVHCCTKFRMFDKNPKVRFPKQIALIRNYNVRLMTYAKTQTKSCLSYAKDSKSSVFSKLHMYVFVLIRRSRSTQGVHQFHYSIVVKLYQSSLISFLALTSISRQVHSGKS